MQKGVRQHPLLKGLQSYGMINTFQDECSICPEASVNPNDPAIKWLIHGTERRPGIIDPICSKHGLSYELKLNDKGELTAIILYGKVLEVKQIQELCTGATWAFSRA
jgi:hypothetical protein